MEGRQIAIIVVVLAVIAGGWYLLSVTPAEAPTTGDTTNNTTAPVVRVEGTVIVYTDQGYFPPEVTVTEGTEVTFLNQSGRDMWPASAMHPTHTVYSGTTLAEHCPDTEGTAFDACGNVAPGGMYTFTFTKAGTWKYHDHLDATKSGSVTVTK